MWKKVLALSIFLIMFSTNFASAADTFKCGEPLYDKAIDEEVENYKKEEANMAEKFLVGQIQNLFHIGGINGLSSLVFGNPYCVWNGQGTEMSQDGIFTLEEREKIINPLLKLFSGIYVSLIVLAMMASGLKLGFSSVKGQAMSEFWEDLKMWVLSAIFVAAYFPITNLVFEVNAGLISSIKDLLISQGVKVDGFSIMSNFKDALSGIPVVSFLLAVLAEWVIALILNIVYIARKIVILVLLVLGFVAAYSLLFARSRAFFSTWVKELIGNVFLQSIHAIILFAFAMMSSMGAGTIYKLGMLTMFIPVTGMISRWLKMGDSSSKIGSAMTMMGLGGVMSTLMLTKQAGNIVRGGNIQGGPSTIHNQGNNGLPQAMSGGMSGGDPSFSGGVVNFGGGSDSANTKISTDASGASSSSWQNTKKTLSNIGGAVFGSAGAVAGPAGAVLMGTVGAKTLPMITQGARNVASGAYNVVDTIRNAKNYQGEDGKKGIGALMGNLQERRTFMGNMGESLGSMVGLGHQGRQLGHGLSGVSRQRLMSTLPENGGKALTDIHGKMMPASFQSIQQQYPGSEIKYIQTNKESSLWMKNPSTNNWSQVGLTGQADPTLKRGAARVIDYKVPEATSPFQLQPNGSYKNIGHSFSNDGSVKIPSSVEGLPGSTQNLMRKSNAYIVGTGKINGNINSEMVSGISSPNSLKYEDRSFNASRINPDSFIAHNITGADMRSRSDKMADSITGTNQKIQKASGWIKQKINDENRQKRVL